MHKDSQKGYMNAIKLFLQSEHKHIKQTVAIPFLNKT